MGLGGGLSLSACTRCLPNRLEAGALLLLLFAFQLFCEIVDDRLSLLQLARSNVLRRSLHKILQKMGREKCGFHAFDVSASLT